MIKKARIVVLAVLTVSLGGCLGIPDGTQPVQDFELNKYLGTWYEIARLDHSFERGLSNVSAQYSKREQGGIKVVNRGFNVERGNWKESVGKAFFDGDQSTGKLKVSFFGPFYGAYNVIALDKDNYQWSMVVGPDTDYLWILSRTPVLEQNLVDQLLQQAKSHGFDIDDLIFVDQKMNCENFSDEACTIEVR